MPDQEQGKRAEEQKQSEGVSSEGGAPDLTAQELSVQTDLKNLSKEELNRMLNEADERGAIPPELLAEAESRLGFPPEIEAAFRALGRERRMEEFRAKHGEGFSREDIEKIMRDANQKDSSSERKD